MKFVTVLLQLLPPKWQLYSDQGTIIVVDCSIEHLINIVF